VKKILVVDDEFISRTILQKLTSLRGEVQACSNGLEALEAFVAAAEKGEPFSLICMDVLMPVMDGVEALRRIREHESSRGIPREAGIKVVMTTGLGEHDSELTDVRPLFDTTMTKPFRLQTVIETLASLGH